jgi:type IV pilus assembly protein PilQ
VGRAPNQHDNETKILTIKNEGDRMDVKLSIKFFLVGLLIMLTTATSADQSVQMDAQIPLRKLSSKASDHSEKITLNFQDIKIRAVLQLLSELTGINMVASDSIQGSMTLRLSQVPWDEALDIILKTQGLAQRKIGNVMLIAPIDEMAAREKQELRASQEVADLSPVVSELININYATAADIAGLIQDKNNSLLSSRGHIATDTRTNTLWVQDTQKKIGEIKKVLEHLDRPVRQVLIEARVVTVNLDDEKDLGVRFGLTKKNFLSGDLDSANALSQGIAPQHIPLAERLNMDFRAAPVVGHPATIAVALARLGAGYLLDLELSALESEGHGNVISSPRLITADQQTARIESGEEIPYQESTSSGATNVAFKKAVLSLQVTPHITPDNKLILTLEVHQDTRGTTTVNGVPAIKTRQIQTNVLVDNGETIVLGGIYEQITTHSVERIPLMGDLPVVGRLFRNSQDMNKHSELLIFVTPKIIEKNLA